MSEPTRVRIDEIEITFDDLCWFFVKAIVAFLLSALILGLLALAPVAVWVYAFNGGDWPFIR